MYAEQEYRFDQILVEEPAWRDAGLLIPLHNRVVGPYLRKFASCHVGLEEWDAVPHVWSILQGRTPRADRAIDRIAAFLRSRAAPVANFKEFGHER